MRERQSRNNNNKENKQGLKTRLRKLRRKRNLYVPKSDVRRALINDLAHVLYKSRKSL